MQSYGRGLSLPLAELSRRLPEEFNFHFFFFVGGGGGGGGFLLFFLGVGFRGLWGLMAEAFVCIRPGISTWGLSSGYRSKALNFLFQPSL